MKKLLLILLSLPFIGFGQQIINDSILVNGTYRHFITYVPSIYQPSVPTPLVLNLHGRTMTAEEQMFYGDFRDIADTANFILVHPQGLLDNLGLTHWNFGQSNIDDIGFFNLLYSYIISNYNINLDQVYSAGFSYGGYMSHTLACNMSDKIAAIASVSGAMSSLTQSSCNPTHPTPVMEIHGTSDFIVLFNDISDGIEYWRDFNNCNLVADTMLIQDLNLTDLSSVQHIIYKNGNNGVTTELFKVNNGGHTWPSSSIITGITNYDINASEEIWKFFSKYDINGLISQPTLVNDHILNKNLVKVTDLLGRETKQKNQPLFYIYDDGTVEKRITID